MKSNTFLEFKIYGEEMIRELRETGMLLMECPGTGRYLEFVSENLKNNNRINTDILVSHYLHPDDERVVLTITDKNGSLSEPELKNIEAIVRSAYASLRQEYKKINSNNTV